MSSAKVGWLIVLLCGVITGRAWGQTAPAPSAHRRVKPVNSEVPSRWFQLQMPPLALNYSWKSAPTPGFETLRWPTYDAGVSLGGDALHLQLFNRTAPAIELDCRSTLCEPMLEKSIGLEGQFHLGGRGILPDSSLFIRREDVQDSIHDYQRLRIGLDGQLDL
jgi:hypothetical protein